MMAGLFLSGNSSFQRMKKGSADLAKYILDNRFDKSHADTLPLAFVDLLPFGAVQDAMIDRSHALGHAGPPPSATGQNEVGCRQKIPRPWRKWEWHSGNGGDRVFESLCTFFLSRCCQ